MNNHNGVITTVARKEGIAQAAPQRRYIIKRAAESLSRRNVDQATCEVINEALARLTMLCYERDDDGRLCNVDTATGRILLPLPWGRAGYTKWGLSPTEADIMRAIMFHRQHEGLPLFFFDRSRRSWFVNLADYPTMPVVSEWEISVNEYRQARANGSRQGR